MKAVNFSKIAIAAAAIVFFATISFTNAQVKDVKNQGANKGSAFVDANGDGICDNFGNPNVVRPKDGSGRKNGKGKGMGMGLRDGSGKGSGNGSGTGVCNGTGPKGNGKGRK